MKTVIQELKSDLVLTKETTKNSFLEIENQEIRKVCIGVVEITLNAIIKRIDTELLAMEKEQRKKDFVNGYKSRAKESNLIFDETSEKYAIYLFNETFKSE
jgi:hypothetical protein